jgi:hypothetical protein
MANIFQSSQNKATIAPTYYTDYLNNLATAGTAAAGQAKFAGTQPLQTKAFEEVGENFGAAKPALATGQRYLGQAAGQDVTGAAAPYLQAGTTNSPLSAASPYLEQAVDTSPADLAAEYMNPYLRTAVSSMSDIAQRNIRQNLSPQATAAAVGSGQFGSQRGAQVLGQVQSDAQQNLNNQIAQMMSTGYGQALCAAGKQNALTSQVGATTGTLQASQNQANLTAAQAAADAAAKEGSLQTQAGTGMGALASQCAAMNLACINALATLGGQQQTIAQNQQNFPLSTLSSLSGLLQGYSIPVGTRTTVCASPASTLAGGVSGAMGLYDKSPGFKSLIDAGLSKIGISGGLSSSGGGGGTINLGGGIKILPDGTVTGGSENSDSGMSNQDIQDLINGGGTDIRFPELSYNEGNDNSIDMGECCCCYFFSAKGGLIKPKARGFTGCASTKYRGALPSKKG